MTKYWRDALLRLRALLFRRQMDDELKEELEFHLEMQTRKNEANLDPAEGRRQARLQFGSLERTKEECREARGINLIETVSQDLHYGMRMLRKAPAFSAGAIGILALGIGATTVLFSVIYGLVLEPFPYKDVNRCVILAINAASQDQPVNSRGWFYIAELEAICNRNNVFEDIAGYNGTNVEWEDGSGARNFRGAFVTTNTFDLLGMRAYRGRVITPADGNLDSAPVFVMNFKIWQSQFGGDPAMVGKSFRVNGELRTLVGIMPPRFQFADGAGIWLPLSLRAGAEGQFIARNLPVGLKLIGRLRNGVSSQRAAADVDVILHGLAKMPATDGRLPYPKRFTVSTEHLRDAAAGNFQKPLYALFGAVTMLLLIACGNVANLLLSRATARKREIAVRASLGATRSRLFQQLLIEVFVLSAIACLCGCALAYLGLKGILTIIPPRSLPPEVFFGMSLPVVLFAMGATLVTTVLCGLAPALHAIGGDLRAKLASTQIGMTADSLRGRFRSSLVVFEMALSIVLLVGAGLMARTFFALTHVELGFNQDRLLYARIALPKSTPEQKRAFFQQVLEKLKSTPGVIAAAEVAQVPTLGGAFPKDVKIFGNVNQGYNGMFDLCSTDLSQTLGLHLLHGRLLSETDVNSARLVAVVNRTLAKQYFGERDPIGQKIAFRTFDFIPDAPHNVYFEIVGVVSDFQNTHLRDAVIPEAFLPYTITAGGGRTILVRTAVDPHSLLRTIEQQVTSVDAAASVGERGVFQDVIDSQVKEPRFELITLNSFAAIGLLLAIAGVFSVMAHSVSLQTREIGIRMALGAKQATIMGMVVRKGLLLVSLGAICGIGVSFWLTRFIASQIWGISARDPLTFSTAVLLIVFIGLLACMPPARRATRVDPMIALRYE